MTNYQKKIRRMRYFGVFTAANLMFQTIFPVGGFALTGGPSQPEVESFEPIGTTEMVDLFTGGFTYNIPLMDVGGYPLNLAYHSGISMDQEASWTGLGWNINPGAITRNMRGLPDDFKGDIIETETKIRPNTTIGLNGKFGGELLGFNLGKGKKKRSASINAKIGLGINYNNYKGWGIEFSVSPAISIANHNKGNTTSLGFGTLSSSTTNGISYSNSPSFAYNVGLGQSVKIPVSISITSTYNTRGGLKYLTFGGSIGAKIKNFSAPISIANGSSTISFNSPTYYPSQAYSFSNTNLSINGNIGGEVFIYEPNFRLTGYFSTQTLKNKIDKTQGFGYLYLQDGYNKDKVLLDFNREKEGSFSPKKPNLPLANLTYDIYSVTGQGIGGMIRPHRSEIGFVFDSKTRSGSFGFKAGIEAGFGFVAHLGGSFGFTFSSSQSGNWKQDNSALKKLKYHTNEKYIAAGKISPKVISDDDYLPLYEPVYFKNAGEKVMVDQSFQSGFFDDQAARMQIVPKPEYNAGVTGKLERGTGSKITLSNTNYIGERAKRNQVFSYLNAKEAEVHALEPNPWYTRYNGGNYSPTILSRNNDIFGTRKPHHISEVTMLQPGGWRYIYGIPAYNTKHEEVSFNVGTASGDCSTGLVTYGTNDNTLLNNNEPDHFYSKKKIPPYAHSYLLTAVVSPDYVDLQSDGITDDDLGNAVELKYLQKTANYKWRVPFGTATKNANYNEGFKSKKTDNKGSYLFGQKEIWYLYKVESKTHVAEFYLSLRNDGLGVQDEDGVQDTTRANRQMKLDSIKLFAVPDWKLNADTATPIKTVHFEYNYELCQGIENYEFESSTTGGKLTLKKLWFTYGNTQKGKLNAYQFHYADYDHDGVIDSVSSEGIYNPDYNIKGYDRWGNYKPNTTGCDIETDPMPNADYPYTDQDTIPTTDKYYDSDNPERTYADAYAIAWNMTTIDLPSGGSINIDYESDDYAYVQDKRAMQMYKLAGVNDEASLTGMSDYLYDSDGNRPYLIFKLPEKELIPNSWDFFGDMDLLYFRALTRIKKRGIKTDSGYDPAYEYVPGYCEIEEKGFLKNGGTEYTHGYIKLKQVSISDNKNGEAVNPIAKAGINYARLHLPELVYPGSNPKGTGESAIKGIFSQLNDIMAIFRGINKQLKKKGFCDKIISSKSYIRLMNPSYAKQGGGERVKKVAINDHWADMLGNTNQGENFEYGQEFDYTVQITGNGLKSGYSSGVASYEPMIGGDENPFRMPVYWDKKALLAPDERNYLEEPFGESWFPSPSVGYGQVTVKNLQHENVSRSATGKTIHEFYTAKDFPVHLDQTGLDPIRQKNNPIRSFLMNTSEDAMTASQGYVIELNDMHGKPKGQTVYPENSDIAISGVEYNYKTRSDNGKRLDNEVRVMKSDGSISNATVGKEMDMVVDFQKSTNQTFSISIQLNVDAFLLGIFPAAVPSFWPPISSEFTRFSSASVTKVINRFGILDYVTAYDFSSEIQTVNEVWDAETGEVLLTRTYNEYKDPVYNFTYPAHMAYDEMGGAYKNIGATVGRLDIIDGIADLSAYTTPSDYLVRGDELMIISNDFHVFNDRFWVLDVDDGNKEAYLVNKYGRTVDHWDVSLKVVRSGRRNLQNTPLGSITALADPVSKTPNSMDSVINASAVVYSDRWQTLCSDDIIGYDCTQDCKDHDNMKTRLTDLFNSLANNDDFNETEDTVQLGAGTDHTEYIGLEGYNPYSDDLPHYWHVLDNTDSTFYAIIGPNFEEGCVITFTLPRGYTLPAGLTIAQFWDYFAYAEALQARSPEDDCYKGGNYDFTFQGAFIRTGGEEPFELTPLITGKSDCYILENCTPILAPLLCMGTSQDPLNPYVTGIRGVWRPKNSYQFDEIREGGNTIRFDGELANFEPFWQWKSGVLDSTLISKWISPVTITKYNPYGFEVENQDILGRYSSAVYGYNQTLPIAVAGNAAYSEVAFDGMEDYDFYKADCFKDHFSFRDNPYTLSDTSHTGLKSIRIDPDSTFSIVRSLDTVDCVAAADDTPYSLKDCDCLGLFAPIVDTIDSLKYVVGFWVMEDTIPTDYEYATLDFDVKIGGSSVTLENETKSLLIEGWQRIEYIFEVDTGSTGNIEVIFDNNSTGTQKVYVDDIRIHPYNSTMESYVYHPITLKLTAQLDNNNYATFYEYDQEGNLIRIKKETERGIVTLQESRNNLQK